MADKGFQEPELEIFSFPDIYTYESARIKRREINLLIEKLKRPNHYLDSLVINMYEELIDFLKNEQFAGSTLFDLILEKEKEDPEEASDWVIDEINEGKFYENFTKKVNDHFGENNEKKVYLILHGFGSAYPYLRSSDFLKKTEQLIKEFKVIVFYPGDYTNNTISFGFPNDDNLIELIKQSYSNRIISYDNN
jgi:hypothetical protein